MKVLFAHNFYQRPGGEDQVFAAEAAMLMRHGHTVVRYCYHNDEIDDMSRFDVAASTLWNRDANRDLRGMIRTERPDICHFHNTFPLMSPAVFHAAKSEGVPSVVTLHNYRYLCPDAVFMRDGRICEDCLGKAFPWPAVAHKCYRGSRVASAVSAALLFSQRRLSKSLDHIGVFIALTAFAREKFIQGGLPPQRIFVKPNFVDPDPGFSPELGRHALFVGRLSEEKGIRTLLDAWEQIGSGIPLRIIGSGPLEGLVRKAADANPGITWMGQLPRNQVIAEMQAAGAFIFPSIWYEGFALTLVESFATGAAVIASNLGSMASLIEDGVTGMHFTPGDSRDLAAKVRWAFENPIQVDVMRRRARLTFEQNYTAASNYEMLIRIYAAAREISMAGRTSPETLPFTAPTSAAADRTY